MFNLNYKSEIDNISKWIKETVNSAGFSKVIIALSGGIDSAVSCALAVNALGQENVYCVLMPYGELSSEHTKDARLVTEHLQIPKENIFEIDIKSSVDVIVNQKKPSTSFRQKLLPEQAKRVEGLQNNSERILMGNIMARVRMTYLFDLAKKQGALVCGTENKTEHLLGYFTRFGDEASDIEPVRSFYKTQIWELGKYLGLPGKIIQKAPTAGLWENQTDEGEFGFSYKKADEVLFYSFEEHVSKEEIVKKGIDKETVEKVLHRVKINEFKHKLPYLFNNLIIK